MYETGFARSAALKRVTHNGTQFSINAEKSATAGRVAIQALTTKAYKTSGPGLLDMLLLTVPDDVRSELSKGKSVRRAQVAMTGAYLYYQAAILGMLVAKDPAQFIAMTWDPVKVSRFHEVAEEESERFDEFSRTGSANLAYFNMITADPELYDPWHLAAYDQRKIARLANSPVSLSDTERAWRNNVALGLGLGIRRPEIVMDSLEASANPDRESWTSAYEAGLDIPTEPDPLSAEDAIANLRFQMSAIFGEYYPEARLKLASLAAQETG